MSGKVVGLVFAKVLGNSTRKVLLACCAELADDAGRGVWASKKTLAEATELGRSTVIRVMQEFVAEGLLREVGKRPGRNGPTIVYDIDLAALALLDDAQADAALVPQQDQSLQETSSPAGLVPERELTSPAAGPKPSMNRPKNEEADASSPARAGKRKAPVYRIPDDWDPGDRGRAYAADQGLTAAEVAQELPEFRVYWADDGTRRSEQGWDMTWQRRCRLLGERAARSRSPPANGHAHPASPRSPGNDWSKAHAIADRLASLADRSPPDPLPPLLPARH